MSQRNLENARRFYLDAYENVNLTLVDELVATDCNIDDPAMPGVPHGAETVKAMIREYKSAFPDLHFDITDEVAAGNTVVLRWVACGTHTGTMNGMDATGRTVAVPGIVIMRFSDDGKIHDAKVVWDAIGLQRQLGLLASAATA